jgi:hypothetical protein
MQATAKLNDAEVQLDEPESAIDEGDASVIPRIGQHPL